MKPLNDNVKAFYHDDATYSAFRRREIRGDAGLDLYCPEEITIDPKDTKRIDFLIQCEGISDSDSYKNVCYYLHCRSSISKTPLRLANSVGIIDAGYRGNLMAAVDNTGDAPYTIEAGQRLFQFPSFVAV